MSGCVEVSGPINTQTHRAIGRWTRTSCLRWISLNQKCEMRKCDRWLPSSKKTSSGMRNQFLHDLERYCKITCFALVFEFISATSKSSCSQLYSCLLHRWDDFIHKGWHTMLLLCPDIQFQKRTSHTFHDSMMCFFVHIYYNLRSYDQDVGCSSSVSPLNLIFFGVPCYQKS